MFTLSRRLSRLSGPFPPYPRSKFSTQSEKPASEPSLLYRAGLVVRFGAAAYIIQNYVANSTMSVGPSMLPTFNATGDILFTEFITPRLRRLRAGDVVVATKPTDHRVSIVKRVRGMPGDTIWVHPFGQPQPVKIRVPLDHVWLEGDNHHQSTDSREYGPVPLVLVRGKVWFRFWPLSQAKWVESRVVDHTEGLRILTSSPSFIPAPSKNHSMCDVVHHASQGVSAAEED